MWILDNASDACLTSFVRGSSSQGVIIYHLPETDRLILVRSEFATQNAIMLIRSRKTYGVCHNIRSMLCIFLNCKDRSPTLYICTHKTRYVRLKILLHTSLLDYFSAIFLMLAKIFLPRTSCYYVILHVYLLRIVAGSYSLLNIIRRRKHNSHHSNCYNNQILWAIGKSALLTPRYLKKCFFHCFFLLPPRTITRYNSSWSWLSFSLTRS